MKQDEDREYVQSLERGLSVLQSFSAQNPRMTLSEVAELTGLTRATARRFLLTLLRLNFVGSDGKYFWLMPSVLDLGYRYLSGLPWWQDAQPIIEDISRALGETCSISVIDGTNIVYVSRVSVNRIISSTIGIGSRFPALATAMGRAIISGWPDAEIGEFIGRLELVKYTDKTVVDPDELRAHLVECRRKGYAMSDGEYETTLRGLAVPIFNSAGRSVAALGISVHTGAETATSLVKRGLPALQDGSKRISLAVRDQQF